MLFARQGNHDHIVRCVNKIDASHSSKTLPALMLSSKTTYILVLGQSLFLSPLQKSRLVCAVLTYPVESPGVVFTGL